MWCVFKDKLLAAAVRWQPPINPHLLRCHASENINVSDLTPLSESGPFILVIVQFFVWGGVILNGYPLSDSWDSGSWENKLVCVADLNVPALTQSRPLFAETSPDYPNIDLTPDSRETTHKDTGKTRIPGDKPSSVCSERGACLLTCWQKKVHLVTFILARFHLTHFSEPSWLEGILLYSSWEGKKIKRVWLFEEDAKNTWLKWWHTENDIKGDRYTNEEAKALQ